MKRFIPQIFVVLLLSGCSRTYIEWGKKTFEQADTILFSVKEAQRLVQTQEIITNFFETCDVVHILPFTNLVQDAYVELSSECKGCSAKEIQEEKKLMYKESENNAIFYVRMDGKKEDWSFALEKDGVLYSADNVEIVDLDTFEKVLFGKRAMRFKKNTYKVTFNTPMILPLTLQLCNGEVVSKIRW